MCVAWVWLIEGDEMVKELFTLSSNQPPPPPHPPWYFHTSVSDVNDLPVWSWWLFSWKQIQRAQAWKWPKQPVSEFHLCMSFVWADLKHTHTHTHWFIRSSVICTEHSDTSVLYVHDERSGESGEKGFWMGAWMEERIFLNESNVLLSMCLPCMPPPSLPISHSIHFLPLGLPQLLQPPSPTPSHISAIPSPWLEWMETGQGNRSTVCVCVCVCPREECGPPQSLAPLETVEGTG